MKIFTLHLGVYGGIAVVAPNIERAVELMRESRDDVYDSEIKNINEHAVVEGVVLDSWGDR